MKSNARAQKAARAYNYVKNSPRRQAHKPPMNHEKLRSFCLRTPPRPLVLTGLYSKAR